MKMLFLVINHVLKLLLMFVGCLVVFAEMKWFLEYVKYGSRFVMIFIGC
jgi:hypothetical protein